jgi:CHAT domain-containing protein/Tfp pilus assembly protein PilF
MRSFLFLLLLLFLLSKVAGQVAPSLPVQSDKYKAGLEEARQLVRAGHIEQAGARCKDLLAQLDTISQRTEYASLLTLQGTIARAGGHLQNAIFLHKKALSIRTSVLGGQSEQASSSYLNLGNCLLEMEAPKEALLYLQKGVDIKKSIFGENDPRLINSLNSIGTCYEKTGEYRRARNSFAKALQIGEMVLGRNSTANIPALTNLSSLYLSQNMPDSAMTLLKQSLIIQTDSIGEIHPTAALIYNNMGFVSQKKGTLQAAFPFFQKALAIYSQLPNSYRVAHANCLQNMGNCFLELGDTRSAIPYFNRANTLLIYHPNKQAGNLNNLGLTYLYMGLSEEAIEIFNNALGVLYSNGGSKTYPELVAGSLQNLGSCLMAQQEFTTALKIYREAESYIKDNISVRELSFNIKIKIAECQRRLGQLEAAAISLEEAKSALRYLNPSQEFTYHYIRGNILFQKQDYALAVDAYQMALQSLSGKDISEGLYPFETIQAYSALSVTYSKLRFTGHWERALDYSVKSITELEKLKGQTTNFSTSNNLQDIFNEPYQIAVEACLQLNRKEKAFEFSERYRGSFLRQLAFRTGVNNLDSTTIKRASLESQIAYLKKERFIRADSPFNEKDIQSIGKLDSSILDLSLQFQQIESKPDQSQNFYLTLNKIQQQLQPDESLLQYHWGDGKVILFLVQQKNFQTILLPDTIDLSNKITELYRLSSLPHGLINTTSTQQNFLKWTTISHQIYRTVLSPALSFIHGQRLIIIPDGPLCYVPFELLLQTRPKEPSFFRTHDYLVRNYEISYLHAASLLVASGNATPDVAPSHRILAIAPIFEENSLGLQPLKNNILETQTILDKMGGLALKGNMATEGNYLQELSRSQIIHFSTHGILNDRAPEFSYLAFSEIQDSIENEQLFISEINHQPTSAELVVLSACQTASGRLQQGEGMASLAQAFLHAGAQSLVASLWNVDDQETPTLMSHFYNGLYEGLDKSEALRQAQLAYLETANHKKAHPYYWAGFIHFGNNAPLKLDTNKGFPDDWLRWWWLPIGLVTIVALGYWVSRHWITPKNRQS